MIVVNLPGMRPPARYDSNPWTQARVEEAPAIAGPWSAIETVDLAPPDADPEDPQPRNLTTMAGTLDIGWYRVTWLDAAGASSQSSALVQNTVDEGLLPPAPETVRRQSPLLRAKFPLPLTDADALMDLRNTVYTATAIVSALTFRIVDPSMGCLAPEGYSCEAVPDGLVPTAFQAVRLMTEHLYVTSEPDFAEQLATGRLLRGFSAGPYSEQYFAPGEFARRGAQQGRPMMNPDEALDEALWALATEDARDYFVWRATGQAPPTGMAIGFDYRREHIGYGAGSLGGWPARSGPDGW